MNRLFYIAAAVTWCVASIPCGYGVPIEKLEEMLLKKNQYGILCSKGIKIAKDSQGKPTDVGPDDPDCRYLPLVQYISQVLVQLNTSMNALDGEHSGGGKPRRLSQVYLIDDSVYPNNAFTAKIDTEDSLNLTFLGIIELKTLSPKWVLTSFTTSLARLFRLSYIVKTMPSSTKLGLILCFTNETV